MRSHLLLLLLLLPILNGCFSLSSDYREMNYYILDQMPPVEKNTNTIKGGMMLRTIRSASYLETDNLMAMESEYETKRYYYNKWVSTYSELAYDFLLRRFNEQNLFADGVFRGTSAMMPDYFLECQLMEMMAYNDEDEDENNYVKVVLQVNFIKLKKDKPGEDILFNKIYEYKIERASYKVNTIASAFSRAWSALADEIIFDMVKYSAVEDLKEDNSANVMD